MFHVGDFVTGNSKNEYVFTNSNALMIITAIDYDYNIFSARIIAETRGNNGLGTEFDDLEADKFNLVESINDWIEEGIDIVTVNDIEEYMEGNRSMTVETMELKMVKNEYNIPNEQLEYYKNEIMEFLPKYRYKEDRHYNPTDKGVNAILAEYNKNKGWMYPYFMSHPNYIGNGKIAFSANYHRKVNPSGVRDFISWITDKLQGTFGKAHEKKMGGMTYQELRSAISRLEDIYSYMGQISHYTIGQATCSVRVNGMTRKEVGDELIRVQNLYRSFQKDYNYTYYNGDRVYMLNKDYETLKRYNSFLEHISDNPHMFVTEVEVDKLNRLTNTLDLRIVAGQKMSRVIGKFCRKLGLDKVDNYSQMFAKLGDDINELDIKRHTIISINPIDYYTMSFGNSWSSCHTIDKMNDRNSQGSHYHGQYSGGTGSYLLDGSSIVYYTVDHNYNGTDFEFQPKVNRCMFHMGEDKLIQGRVYPQNNDGDDTIYNEIRAIMQKVVSEMFGFNNLWILKKGTSECSSMINTEGKHYPDYRHFNNCTISYIKPEEGKKKNINRITVGHVGICPRCGETHYGQEYIICGNCYSEIKRCPHCGSRISDSDHIEIDGEVYCSHCAHYCNHHERYEVDTRMILVRTGMRTGNFIEVCEEAIRENPERYRRDYYSHGYYDTQVYTDGIVTGDGYYLFTLNREVPNPERGYHSADRDWKMAYNGKYYLNDNTIYDRRCKQWIPITEWDSELNCWNGISEQVREHNEMLARRAERREARRARREAENVA